MKTVALATALLLSAATAVALHGQTSPSSSNATRVTVTGCVERASTPAPATTTTGTTGTTTPETKFVLTHPTSGTTTTTGTTGTTTAPPSPSLMSATEYRLDDADESKVSPHVGHKVEITGTVDQQSRSSVGTTGSTATTTSGTTAAASSPKLKVESVRMISATCPD